MTMIGGFLTDEVQLLLSDNLLSTNIPTGSELQNLPMWRGGKLPSELNAARLVQKLHLFNERVALCWSGSPITARSLIQKLQPVFSGSEFPADEQIARAITPYRDSDVSFILAMIHHGEVRVISSKNILHDSYKNLGEILTGGTGRNDLLYFLSSDKSGKYSENGYGHIDEEVRPYFVASHIEAKLGAIMFGGKKQLINRWGGGSEVAVRVGDQFLKVGGTIYGYNVLSKEKSGQLTLDTYATVTTKLYVGENLLLNDYNFTTGSHSSYVIPPLVAKAPDSDILINNGLTSDKSFALCANVTFIDIPGPINKGILVSIEKPEYILDFVNKMTSKGVDSVETEVIVRENTSRMLGPVRKAYEEGLLLYS